MYSGWVTQMAMPDMSLSLVTVGAPFHETQSTVFICCCSSARKHLYRISNFLLGVICSTYQLALEEAFQECAPNSVNKCWKMLC